MENVEQVYCKHTYPPEKIILFQAGVKYQVYSKCELSIVLISGAGGYLVTFNIGKPWLYGKPMFDEYFINPTLIKN